MHWRGVGKEDFLSLLQVLKNIAQPKIPVSFNTILIFIRNLKILLKWTGFLGQSMAFSFIYQFYVTALVV